MSTGARFTVTTWDSDHTATVHWSSDGENATVSVDGRDFMVPSGSLPVLFGSLREVFGAPPRRRRKQTP